MVDTQANISTNSSLVQTLLASNTTASTMFQIVWLLIRIIAGGLMIHNGLDKLADIHGFADNVVSFIGLPYPVFFTYCAAYVEIISAVLLMLGLLTRLNALALLATMVVAIFFHIKADGLQIPPLETASLYAGFYAFFLVNGAGQWSLDQLITNQVSSSDKA
ncbi:MAG: DoxX family protein [Leptolyngbyaceae cyanobacterium MAG.088]|nr:DoxX family protein [Leptolyngbyaceae cyanobacterium MAG.088]